MSLEEMRRLVQEELSKQLDGEDVCPTAIKVPPPNQSRVRTLPV